MHFEERARMIGRIEVEFEDKRNNILKSLAPVTHPNVVSSTTNYIQYLQEENARLALVLAVNVCELVCKPHTQENMTVAMGHMETCLQGHAEIMARMTKIHEYLHW
jgi:hypothetical protein